MKRRKTPQSLRATEAARNRVKATKATYDFFDFGSSSFITSNPFVASGTLSFTNFQDGDYILLTNDGGGWTHFGIDLAKRPTNPKRVHPARRRKMIREGKAEINGIYTITSGGSSSINCKKIDETTWEVIGDVS